ncbi:MAG: protein-L-isoaspartate(D-aspartate) O-methyltransferase [Planctomycetes bacterium]|nr:protein-L-isoaspartate(D-aspartate) O-methyltransferase [Planctomycetota bacterium]
MTQDGGENDRRTEREEMVTFQIERRGIRTVAVLDAMRRIPREWFVPPGSYARAYDDSALPIDCDQTISQPYMVARMTELLELTATDSVLEIGSGSGYQTAILARLARHVYTVEWHEHLMQQALARLRRLGLDNVTLRCADGSLGWPEHAPYEAIIVTAGAPNVPAPLEEQLATGGRLVVPVGSQWEQTLVCARRTATGLTQQRVLGCRFVKLLGAAGWQS